MLITAGISLEIEGSREISLGIGVLNGKVKWGDVIKNKFCIRKNY